MNFRLASEGEALVLADEQYPGIVRGIDCQLKNGTGGALVKGDLVMLDKSSAGVSATTGEYTQVIAPTVAGNLAAAGFFHLVAQEAIASGASGRFRLFGDTILNLATSSATIGSKIGTNGTALTGEVTAIVTLTKVIGMTKIATTTGRVRVFFDGRPPGLAIAP
jgi:hypothetical protein